MQEEMDIAPAPKRRFPKITLYPWVRYGLFVAAISLFVTLLVLFILALVLWRHKERVLSYLDARLPQQSLPAPEQPVLEEIPKPAEEKKQQSVTDVVALANKSVVAIEVSQEIPVYETVEDGTVRREIFPGLYIDVPRTEQRQIGTKTRKIGGGSGFFITKSGMIVTNRHVVDFPNALYTVTTADGKKYSAVLIGKDETRDVALLYTQGKSFSPLALGNSGALELGQSVVAIGYALGEFKNSVSLGVVSGLGRSVTAGGIGGQVEKLSGLIQTDAAINPGNSGGPLLNLDGEVVGVSVAVAEGSQSIGFALPINSIKSFVNSYDY